MKTHKFKFRKLVRNKIVGLIEKSGRKVFGRVMEQDEYVAELKKKLIEEKDELFEAIDSKNTDDSNSAICEELADVLEVVISLTSACGVDFAEVEETARRKKDEKGGFADRIYVEFIEVNEDDSEIEYYRVHPEKYPEDCNVGDDVSEL